MTRTAIALLTGGMLLASFAARSAPLDQETCTKLKAEQTFLEKVGARSGMGKGPEWAKANLPSDRLEQIRRLIELDEQVLFRCSGKPLVELPKDVDNDAPTPDTDAKDAAAKDAGKGGAAKAAKAAGVPAEKKGAAPSKKAAVPPGAKEAATEAAVAKPAPKGAATAAKPKSKSKPKPKPDDAYKPPAAEAGSNPFAGQLGPAQR